MGKNKNLTLIAVETGRTDSLKSEYRVKDECFGLTIHKDTEKKELKVKIMGLKRYMNEFWKAMDKHRSKLSPEEKKKQEEESKETDNKPVDTSNWVKPDEESLRNELLKNLALCEIYDDDSNMLISVVAKRDMLYGILHSHSPSNPQGVMTFHIIDDYDTILAELDNPLKRYFWDLAKKVQDGSMSMDEIRKTRKEWKAAQLSKMITVEK